MRTLVLNTPELRSGLLKVYRCLALGLTDGEWRAVMGLKRQLELGASVQRRAQLRVALADSGLPRPIQWVIEQELGGRDFSPEELAGLIEAARHRV